MISEAKLMSNMDYMRQFPDKFFQIGIVDPPYGIGAEQGVDRSSRKKFKDEEYGWDSKIPEKEYFNELMRVTQNQIIWGGNYFLDILGNARCMIVWDKLNPDRLFADCELAWTSFDEVARIYKEKRVQELNKYDGGKIHPTQKPVHLYHWTMKKYCKKGDKILDTHLGSGNSRKAAHLLGFDFYSCEIKEKFFNDQEESYSNFIKSFGLFLPKEQEKKKENLFEDIEKQEALNFFN